MQMIGTRKATSASEGRKRATGFGAWSRIPLRRRSGWRGIQHGRYRDRAFFLSPAGCYITEHLASFCVPFALNLPLV